MYSLLACDAPTRNELQYFRYALPRHHAAVQLRFPYRMGSLLNWAALGSLCAARRRDNLHQVHMRQSNVTEVGTRLQSESQTYAATFGVQILKHCE